jgi:hypothetical protein
MGKMGRRDGGRGGERRVSRNRESRESELLTRKPEASGLPIRSSGTGAKTFGEESLLYLV